MRAYGKTVRLMADHEDSSAPIDITALVDDARLTAWLDDNIPELGDGPLRTEVVHGGTSNVIISLNRGGTTMILRRPPAVPPPNSEKSVLREARVLTALNGTPVPHPYCYGRCEDPRFAQHRLLAVRRRHRGWPAQDHRRAATVQRDDHVARPAVHHRGPQRTVAELGNVLVEPRREPRIVDERGDVDRGGVTFVVSHEPHRLSVGAHALQVVHVSRR